MTPVSIRTQRAPTARAAARSVAMPSPIITASRDVPPDGVGGDLEQERRRLADRDRGDAGRGLDRGHDAARPGPQAALGRVDRVAVGGDEPGAGADAVRGRRQPQVGELRVEADDDRVGIAGRGPAVDALLAHPRRRMAGGDDLEPDVAQLALEPAGADRRARGGSPAPCRAR